MIIEQIEKSLGQVATSVLLMGVMGCARAEPSKASLPPSTPTPEAQQLPTPVPTETSVPPTAISEPTATPQLQREGIPPKPPTPTSTPIGQSPEPIPQHLFPKETTFVGQLHKKGTSTVTGGGLLHIDKEGNIIWGHGKKQACEADEPNITSYALKVPTSGVRRVAVIFPIIKGSIIAELMPDLNTIRGSAKFEEFRSGSQYCPAFEATFTGIRKGGTPENLGRAWNEVLVSIGRLPVSDQVALDELSSLCRACNIPPAPK